MKRFLFLLLLVVVLTACVRPTPTVSPVPTVTEFPSPQPTPTFPASPIMPAVMVATGSQMTGGNKMDFSDAAVNGIPIMAIILGLVQFSKKFGLAGKWCTLLSMALGLVLGMLYQLQTAMPVDLAGWLSVVIYGLGLGIVTSGVYEVVKKNG